MRHRNSGRKFNMDPTERASMFRNMVTSLLVYGQIKTTEARAKELRGFAERVITLAKRSPSLSDIEKLSGEEQRKARARRVHAMRQARLWVRDQSALQKVFGEYRDRFEARSGGYTRVVKIGKRPGDKADMALIELVDNPAIQASAPAETEPGKATETTVSE